MNQNNVQQAQGTEVEARDQDPDIKGISSAGQSAKRMTLAQDTKCKCVDYE